jgi:DNA-binding Lrp family transcriptional regulator
MYINGIDETDNRIVNILLENGRASYSEIGEAVGLSRTAVKNRVAALEKSGIISGYRAVVNPQNSPEMMTFVVNIETDPEHFENARELFAAAKETVTMVQTTGNCHLLAICVSEDMKTMKNFVNMIFKTADGIRNINAHAVIDVAKGSIIPK